MAIGIGMHSWEDDEPETDCQACRDRKSNWELQQENGRLHGECVRLENDLAQYRRGALKFEKHRSSLMWSVQYDQWYIVIDGGNVVWGDDFNELIFALGKNGI